MSEYRLEFQSTGSIDFSEYDPEDLVTAEIHMVRETRPDGTKVLSLDKLTKDEHALRDRLSDDQKQRREKFREDESKARLATMTGQIANLTTRNIGDALGGTIRQAFESTIQPKLPPISAPNTLNDLGGDLRSLAEDQRNAPQFEIPTVELGPGPSVPLLENIVEELRTQSELNAAQNAKLEELSEGQSETSDVQEGHARFNRCATIWAIVLSGLTLLVAIATLFATFWAVDGNAASDGAQSDASSSTQEETP